MNTELMKAVEFEALLSATGATFKDCQIVSQQSRHDAIKNIVRSDPKPRKRRKAITQRDVITAINDALDAAARELRGHKNDLPRWVQAMDFAIAVIAKHKVSK